MLSNRLIGQYDSVLKANSFLEQYFLDKLHTEVSEQRTSTSEEVILSESTVEVSEAGEPSTSSGDALTKTSLQYKVLVCLLSAGL